MSHGRTRHRKSSLKLKPRLILAPAGSQDLSTTIVSAFFQCKSLLPCLLKVCLHLWCVFLSVVSSSLWCVSISGVSSSLWCVFISGYSSSSLYTVYCLLSFFPKPNKSYHPDLSTEVRFSAASQQAIPRKVTPSQGRSSNIFHRDTTPRLVARSLGDPRMRGRHLYLPPNFPELWK